MNKYDRVIQENILPLEISVVRTTLGLDDAEISMLSRKMQRTLEREAYMVLLATLSSGEKKIYNVEWQTHNDDGMAERMLLQLSMLYVEHKKSIRFQQGREYGREQGRKEAYTIIVSSMDVDVQQERPHREVGYC